MCLTMRDPAENSVRLHPNIVRSKSPEGKMQMSRMRR
jgi:hypothetical protein